MLDEQVEWLSLASCFTVFSNEYWATSRERMEERHQRDGADGADGPEGAEMSTFICSLSCVRMDGR